MNLTKKTSTTIAALTLTAILLVVILLASPQRSLQASMLNAQADFSLMTAGVLGNDDSLIIIDKNAQKIVVYALNPQNRFVPIAGYNYGTPAPVPPPKR
ncbi:MAG: hypothetical protein FWD53_07825 [Phycisphaerales bacterium]|nr:hypothetical protein [Phycisphaerales bacterium]